MKRSDLLKKAQEFSKVVKHWVESRPFYSSCLSYCLGCLTVLLFYVVLSLLFILGVIAGVVFLLAEPDTDNTGAPLPGA